MTRWEYKSESIRSLNENIQRLGREGWELVAYNPDICSYLFKRPVPVPVPEPEPDVSRLVKFDIRGSDVLIHDHYINPAIVVHVYRPTDYLGDAQSHDEAILQLNTGEKLRTWHCGVKETLKKLGMTVAG